jgi:hypothetical protein
MVTLVFFMPINGSSTVTFLVDGLDYVEAPILDCWMQIPVVIGRRRQETGSVPLNTT